MFNVMFYFYYLTDSFSANCDFEDGYCGYKVDNKLFYRQDVMYPEFSMYYLLLCS